MMFVGTALLVLGRPAGRGAKGVDGARLNAAAVHDAAAVANATGAAAASHAAAATGVTADASAERKRQERTKRSDDRDAHSIPPMAQNSPHEYAYDY